MTEPKIEFLREKKLVGKHLSMSVNEDRTFELWKSFMPARKSIKNQLSSDLFCLQVYDPPFDIATLTRDTMFQKWAAAEVAALTEVPDGMEGLALPGGLYAVFLYRGRPADFAPSFQHIFKTWLPQSGYQIDHRPHFQILGSRYKNDDPESEEEVWVPIRKEN